MRRLQPNEFKKYLENEICGVLFTNISLCDRCDKVKEIMQEVQQELPLFPIVEFREAANVYPLNVLTEELNFDTVPTFVVFKGGKGTKVIKSVNEAEVYIKAIKEV